VTATDKLGIVERLRSSAKAFRENSVFTSDGDEVRLGVQADECVEAAALIEELVEALAEARLIVANLPHDESLFLAKSDGILAKVRPQ
jgi:Ni,Fe-hydrogenase III large subunit